MSVRGCDPSSWTPGWRPSYDGLPVRRNALSPCPQRGFLTRRIDYFRAAAPSLANTRKSETPHFQTYRCMTLFVTNRPQFSSKNWPWIENSIPWIGRSMGWKGKSMGWIGRGSAWIHENTGWKRRNFAKTRASVAVRFNDVPYSAQGVTGWRKGMRGDAQMGAECGFSRENAYLCLVGSPRGGRSERTRTSTQKTIHAI